MPTTVAVGILIPLMQGPSHFIGLDHYSGEFHTILLPSATGHPLAYCINNRVPFREDAERFCVSAASW